MAANTSPIFARLPDVQWVASGTSANTNLDGTGTVATAFTADATNGSKVEKIIVQHMGTNVDSVLRLFINNGSTNATAANNALFLEVDMGANTLSHTAESARKEIYVDLPLPAGYKINCTIGTAIAAGYMVTVVGGKY
jgi:hypothetical protein